MIWYSVAIFVLGILALLIMGFICLFICLIIFLIENIKKIISWILKKNKDLEVDGQ